MENDLKCNFIKLKYLLVTFFIEIIDLWYLLSSEHKVTKSHQSS